MWWIGHTFFFSRVRSNKIAPQLSTNASDTYCLVGKLEVAMVGVIWTIAIFQSEYGEVEQRISQLTEIWVP